MKVLLQKKMKSLKKKVIIGLLAFSIIFSGIGVTLADETDDIRKEMSALEEMLAEITEKIGLRGENDDTEETVSIEGIPAGFTFGQNLRQGSRGTDVKYLQILLNADSDTRLANTGPGSPGNETEYFGPITLSAVNKFQGKYSSEVLVPAGASAPTGFVGTYTRAKLNSILQEGVSKDPDVSNEIMEMLQEISERVKALVERVEALEKGEVIGEEGDLSVSLRSDIRNVSVRPNQTKDVAMFRLEAEDSDIEIQRFDVYVDGAMTEFRGDIDEMALKVDGEVVSEREINRDTVGRDDKYIRFSGLNIEVPKNGHEDVVISVTAADKSTFTNTSYIVGPTGDNAIRGVDGARITLYASVANGRSFELDDETAGTLEIRDNDSPEEGVVLIEEDENTEVELLVFDVVVKDSDIDLENLRVEFEGDYDLEEIFEDALLYRGNTLVDVQSITIKEGTDNKEAYVVFEVEMDIDAGETLVFTLVIDVFGMDMEDDGDRIGSKVKAEILADENKKIAYAYDTDKEIDLKGDLEGEYQALYPSLPEFTLKEADIERNDNRSIADAYLTIEVEAVEGDIVLTGIDYFNSHWNVIMELEGTEVYDGSSWTGTTSQSTIKKGRTAELEIFGIFEATDTEYGWVRLAVESIDWEDEEGNDFSWDAGNYEFIEVLRTERVHLTQQL